MNLYKNDTLLKISAEDIKNFDDISFILESCSKSFLKMIFYHFRKQHMIEDRLIKEMYYGAARIGKDNACCEKTVHRFNRALSCVIFKRNRFKDGKQTSNSYEMHKVFYQYLKAFWRLGLFKKGADYEKRWHWIKKMWVDCSSSPMAFMNKVWNHKPLTPKEKKKAYEHSQKKMSYGESQKCPTNLNSLSLTSINGTEWVSDVHLKEIENLLRRKMTDTFSDLKWYALEKGRNIRSWPGIFADRFAAILCPKKDKSFTKTSAV